MGNWGLGTPTTGGDDDNEMGSSLPFVNLGSGCSAKTIRAGKDMTCAILDDDSLKCWGDDSQENWATGMTGISMLPPHLPSTWDRGGVPGMLGWEGSFHTCAILDNNTLVCWGNGWLGQLGTGSYSFTTVEPHAATAANVGTLGAGSQVVTGGSHSCATLGDGTLVCWGENDNGELGVGDTTDRLAPITVNLGSERTAHTSAVSSDTTCAVLDNGSLSCWGRNDDGQLGVGDTNDRNVPTAVALGSQVRVESLAMGESHMCVI